MDLSKNNIRRNNMKTLQELYKEVIASDDLKKEFMEIVGDKENGEKKVEEFLKKNGCDATLEDLKKFFEEKSEEELGEEDLETVAGGKEIDRTTASVLGGIFTLSLLCLGLMPPS